MSFRCDDKKLLKKYEKIWGKIGSIINKKITKGPTYELNNNNTYIKSKIREFGGMIKTDFHDKKCRKKKLHITICL